MFDFKRLVSGSGHAIQRNNHSVSVTHSSCCVLRKTAAVLGIAYDVLLVFLLGEANPYGLGIFQRMQKRSLWSIGLQTKYTTLKN